MTPRGVAWSKQDEPTLESVCESLRAGIPFVRACKLAGISQATGDNWRRAGWAAIENEGEDSDADIPFVVRFALETELALGDFMRPLIERMRDGGAGKSKADWRSAAALLAARFPDEFSEKTHVAKSARLEVSGELAVKHAHEFQHFISLKNMSREELKFEIERVESQIDHHPLRGEELDAEINFAEARLSAMRAARAADYGFVRANWLNSPTVSKPIPIDLEPHEFAAADTLPAPTGTPERGFVHRSSGVPPLQVAAPVFLSAGAGEAAGAAQIPAATAPASARVQTGIGYDAATGLAIPMPSGATGFNDEDVIL